MSGNASYRGLDRAKLASMDTKVAGSRVLGHALDQADSYRRPQEKKCNLLALPPVIPIRSLV